MPHIRAQKTIKHQQIGASNLSVKIVLDLFLQIGGESKISFNAAGKRLKPKILVRKNLIPISNLSADLKSV